MTETLDAIAVRAAREALQKKRERYIQGELDAFEDVKPFADPPADEDGKAEEIAELEEEIEALEDEIDELEDDEPDSVLYEDYAAREYAELTGDLPDGTRY